MGSFSPVADKPLRNTCESCEPTSYFELEHGSSQKMNVHDGAAFIDNINNETTLLLLFLES